MIAAALFAISACAAGPRPAAGTRAQAETITTEYELPTPTLRLAGNRLVPVMKMPDEWDATANQLMYGVYSGALTPDPATEPARFQSMTAA